MDTLRGRKKARTREALVEAALQGFAARGYEAVPVDDIAAAAGVSRRTFFRYFSSKDAVVFDRNDARLARFREALDAAPHPGFAALRKGCIDLAEDYTTHRRSELVRHRIVAASPALLARELELDLEWEQAMARALGGGFAGEVFAGAVMGAVRATLRGWFAGGCRDDLGALGEAALDLVEGGVPSTLDWTRHTRSVS